MRSWWVAVISGCSAGCGLVPYASLSDSGPITDTAVGSPTETVPGRPCPPDTSLTWDSFGARFMDRHCTGCHSSDLSGDVARSDAPELVDLDTLDGVRGWLLRVYSTAADDNEGMPPRGGVSASDRADLGDWLACGAP